MSALPAMNARTSGTRSGRSTTPSPAGPRVRIGFLTYDLQPFTEDCLFRISAALGEDEVTAFPVYAHAAQSCARIPYRPSRLRPRFLGVDREDATPEGFASNLNLGCAWAAARSSDLLVLFGLQGINAIVAAALASLLRKPVISVNQTVPLPVEARRRWWVRWSKRWLLRRCRCHVYQSPASKEVLVSLYRLKERDLFFAPFEAGASSFAAALDHVTASREEMRRRLGLAGREVVFAFVGTLHPFKGVPEILSALALRPSPQIRCIFIGPEEPHNRSGATIRRYQEAAAMLGIKHQVSFLGPLAGQDLLEAYLACDVVLLPTRKDPFPKVLVEGALAGKPLITTTATGAVGAIVMHDVNGIVVEPGDIPGLRDAMERMMDPGVRDRMGRQSRALASRFCNPEREVHGFSIAVRTALGRETGANDGEGG